MKMTESASYIHLAIERLLFLEVFCVD